MADQHGNSFIWEHSHGHNLEYIIEGKGLPQVVTNHPLYLTPRRPASPEKSENRLVTNPADSYDRYRTLSQAIEAHSGTYSVDFLKETNACVFADDAMQQEYTRVTGLELPSPVRTLWHSVYDTAEKSLEVSFYLRDEAGAENTNPRVAIRSGYYRFQLRSQ